jgi:malate dehydrogenase (oxaloacetate-decarboxylating)(NADP+)
MEGKAVLFKKFAGIDVFDIEIAADTIERVVEVIAALEPTFGGINLRTSRAGVFRDRGAAARSA